MLMSSCFTLFMRPDANSGYVRTINARPDLPATLSPSQLCARAMLEVSAVSKIAAIKRQDHSARSRFEAGQETRATTTEAEHHKKTGMLFLP